MWDPIESTFEQPIYVFMYKIVSALGWARRTPLECSTFIFCLYSLCTKTGCCSASLARRRERVSRKTSENRSVAFFVRPTMGAWWLFSENCADAQKGSRNSSFNTFCGASLVGGARLMSRTLKMQWGLIHYVQLVMPHMQISRQGDYLKSCWAYKKMST